MELYAFDDDYVARLRAGDRFTEEHFLRYFNELLQIKLLDHVIIGNPNRSSLRELGYFYS